MSFRFIFGGSGSGKTESAFTDIINSSLADTSGRFIILVPEQNTLQTQKDIVRLHPDHVTFSIDVLSFNRLAYRVFAELGINNPPMMDDIGKAVILRLLAQNCSGKLGIWKDQFHKTGFIDNIKSMISELYQYGISSDDLGRALANTDQSVLKRKLADLIVLYDAFRDYTKGRFITTEELLDVLCNVVKNSKKIRNSTVLFDGFTGFTPVQYRLMEDILSDAKEVIFTVTLPGDGKDSDELFDMSRDMISKITQIAALKNISHGEDIRLTKRPYPRFFGSPQLDYLERNMMRSGRRQAAKNMPDSQAVSIHACLTPAGEAGLASQEILRLVNNGYRYRDIAVIAGDLSGYTDLLRHEFDAASIPFYLDENISINDNPLPELLLAALNCITQAYSYQAFVRFMKCSLSGCDTMLVNEMENYMLACGIHGKNRIEKTWEYTPSDMKNLDMNVLGEEKDRILANLDIINKVTENNECDAASVSKALLTLMESLRAKENLERMRDEFEKKNDSVRVRQYDEVYTQVVELLEKIGSLLGDEKLSVREYAQILETGLAQTGVGMIPAGIDRVVIGDLMRTRLDHVKALLLLGANDEVLVEVNKTSGMLTDREKENLRDCDVNLSPTAREDLAIQRYYVYRCLTKPSDLLHISYAGMDMQGRALRPSDIVKSISRLTGVNPSGHFAGNKNSQDGKNRIFCHSHAGRKFIELLGKLRDDPDNVCEEELKKLYFWFSTSDELKTERNRLCQAAAYCYNLSGIGKDAARLLYTTQLTGSVTRIESFASCPYSHFLRYGLGITPRRIHTVEAVDIGSLAHVLLERVFADLKKEGLSPSDISAQERDTLCEHSLKQALLEDESGLFKDSKRNAYFARRLLRMTKRTLFVLSEQLKRGDFIPGAFESVFRSEEGDSSLNIPLSDNAYLRLSGKVDRIDLCRQDENIFVKIVDYKTGSTKFDSSRLLAGTQLQLFTYLDAVTERLRRENRGKTVIPAAVFYEHIDDPYIDRECPDVDLETLKEMSPTGIAGIRQDVLDHLLHDAEDAKYVLPFIFDKNGNVKKKDCTADDEGFEKLKRFVRKKCAETGEAILDGNIQISPIRESADRTACTYCPYTSVCGFDAKSEGFKTRNIKSLKSGELWEKI